MSMIFFVLFLGHTQHIQDLFLPLCSELTPVSAEYTIWDGIWAEYVAGKQPPAELSLDP